jgi:hypothetical protein
MSELHHEPQNNNHDSLYNLSRIDFRAMIVFITVVEAGGLYSASRILGCSESTVSQILTRFRVRSEQLLFTWEGRRLTPTPYACALAKRLSECFAPFLRVVEGNRAIL